MNLKDTWWEIQQIQWGLSDSFKRAVQDVRDFIHPRPADILGQELLTIVLDSGTTEEWKSFNARRLLRKGANVNAVGPGNVTSLISAATRGEAQLVKELMSAGALVNLQTANGCTALMQAAAYSRFYEEKSLAIARLLLAAGADIRGKHCSGQNALDWAREQGYAPLVDLLQTHENELAQKEAAAAEIQRRHEQWVQNGCPVDQDISMRTIRFKNKPQRGASCR